jgi:hypothetical protein
MKALCEVKLNTHSKWTVSGKLRAKVELEEGGQQFAQDPSSSRATQSRKDGTRDARTWQTFFPH